VSHLLQTQKIQEITVGMVATEAEISIRTFYNHFHDKFDVCNYIYDQILDTRCWGTEQHKSTFYEFFVNICDMIDNDYADFFQHTMCYFGQNCIHEYVVSRGIKDLIRYLTWTEHEDMITPENIAQIEFYMWGLVSTLNSSMYSKTKKHSFLYIQDKIGFLPKNLYDAFNEDPNKH